MAVANDAVNAARRAAQRVRLGRWATTRGRVTAGAARDLVAGAIQSATTRLAGPKFMIDAGSDIAKAGASMKRAGDLASVVTNPEVELVHNAARINEFVQEASRETANAIRGYARPVARFFSAAPEYGGFWGLTKRVSALGAGSFILGSGYRLATGGNPVYDRYGRFNIAGIPFV